MVGKDAGEWDFTPGTLLTLKAKWQVVALSWNKIIVNPPCYLDRELLNI